MPSTRRAGSARQPSAAATPSVRLLGAPQWRRRPTSRAVALSAKDGALLALLALEGPIARPKLCELLWPGTQPERSHASLRSRSSRLHRASGAKFFEPGDAVQLNPRLKVDVLDLDAMDADVLLTCGPLLAGVDLGDCNELDRWLGKARERMAERVALLLERHAQALEQDGRLLEARELARRRVEFPPLSESAWLQLMRLYYLLGDCAAAQEAYWRCRALMLDDLGHAPGVALRDMFDTVTSALRPPATRHHSVPPTVLRPPRMIGREAAWQAMWAAWQQGQAFVVVGDPGQGKSRLLQEFAHGQDGLVSAGAGTDDHLEPLALLGRLLVEVDRRFELKVARIHRGELARIDRHFGRRPAAPGSMATLERAVEELLAAALGRGLRALLVDDVQQADTATIELLRRMHARPSLAGLRLGLTSRPELPRALQAALDAWGASSRRLVRVELQALNAQELDELLASLMLPQLLDRRISERLWKHASGQPLFTLATLQALLLSGQDPARSALPLPATVQALLDARLTGLPERCRSLLQVAAIAGDDLGAERAAAMLGCDVLDLAPAWAALESADVLRGERFSHDLMQEAALRSVPLGLRPALHLRYAQTLQDEGAAPARVAWHWEQGADHAAAGCHWHAAAEAARQAGLLQERNDLLLAAARCHARTGDEPARFEALMARVEGLQLRPGGGAALEALPEVEPLAITDEQRLRCLMARVEARLGLHRPADAVADARAALAAAAATPQRLPDAQALLAQVLVQCGGATEAVALARQALEGARALGDRWQLLRVQQACSFVHYGSGELAAAIVEQQSAVTLADALGNRFEAAAGQGHVAALLFVSGDVVAALEQAQRTRRAHRETGLDADGVLGSVNERVVGSCAAALGRYKEAIDALQAAVTAAGRQAAPAALSRARLALAGLWVTLGRLHLARELLQALEGDDDPARQVQCHWLLARAAETAGEPAQSHWAKVGRLGDALSDDAPMQSIAFEASFQGPPQAAIRRAHDLWRRLEGRGLPGMVRALQWRELARWLDVPGRAATAKAAELAQQIEAHVATGLSAKCHRPEVWLSLAEAHRRAGDEARRRACLKAGRDWLLVAREQVPDEHRESFVQGVRLHRSLLAGT